MKRGWLVVVAIIIIVSAMFAWNRTRPQATLAIIKPVIQDVLAFVEEQAVSELPHDYAISMPINGWLEPIRLREGDVVTVDQVVARLESDDLRDRVLQAEQRIAVLEAQIAEVSDHRLENNALVDAEATVKAIREMVLAAEAKIEATRAVMEFAQHELDRFKNLTEAEAAAAREVRQAEMEFRRAQAEFQSDRLEMAALKTIEAVSYVGPKFIRDYIDRKKFTLEQRQKDLVEARTQLAIEQRNLSRTEIRSPIAGVVLHRHQTRMQYLTAGTLLLTLGDLDEIEVVAEVLTQQATRISPGDPVELFGEALPDGPIQGLVQRVFPAGFKKISALGVEQQRVNVIIELDERPPQLGAGFRVFVRIFYDQAEEAVTLPRTSLFRGTAGGWQVFVVADGRCELRDVTAGIENDDLVQIVAGLDADDAVVARPSRDIEPGMRVATIP
ncbi:MAG: efflux RND transporter periplasmic adaptor subunit [Planctomycetota bacterium]|jgi:HlyD family secretion protein